MDRIDRDKKNPVHKEARSRYSFQRVGQGGRIVKELIGRIRRRT
jgi:hypothetical protein